MRFFLLLLFVLFVPHMARSSQGNDTAASAGLDKIKITQLTGTGPWLPRKDIKEPVSQNQPNPASLYTVIYFYVARTGPVSLNLYDSRGKFIGYFVDGPCVGGETYRVLFPVGILAAGEYFYRFKAGELTVVKKMVIIK
jgi:hypothetical protein